ncbi:MAG: CsbD family protein [Bacteroidales bacterium]|nr:CsbD family protein [Bacteroidales bacterium]
MNDDILKGKWTEMKGEVKKKWGKLTDDDLMVISGEKEKLVGVLQTKYGYAKDNAEKEYKEFIDRQKE